MTTALQRAAARRNIKKAQAANRRHGGKKKSHRSSRSSAGEETRPEGLGAAYTHGRAGLALISPASDALLKSGRSGLSLVAAFKEKGNALKANPAPYIGNVVVTVADEAIDKRMHQAGAISRGSATAILPEAYLVFKAARAAKDNPGSITERGRAFNQAANQAYSGYDPIGNELKAYPSTVTYRLLKHGGQAIRYARSKSALAKRVTKPLQQLASMLGGTI